MHHYKKSVVNQREVSTDTKSYDEALRNAMREAPDVILIGEIRDETTMRNANNYADSTHNMNVKIRLASDGPTNDTQTSELHIEGDDRAC